jgi:hypothetical protein
MKMNHSVLESAFSRHQELIAPPCITAIFLNEDQEIHFSEQHKSEF